jgi:hypothetical protein
MRHMTTLHLPALLAAHLLSIATAALALALASMAAPHLAKPVTNLAWAAAASEARTTASPEALPLSSLRANLSPAKTSHLLQALLTT